MSACERETTMPQLIVVRATWDQEESVWVAESEDVPGLITQADTLEALQKRLPGIVQDLLGADGDGEEVEVPIELIAHASSRVTVRLHDRTPTPRP
jgi:predicted RNase H-like HicB family nuclease